MEEEQEKPKLDAKTEKRIDLLVALVKKLPFSMRSEIIKVAQSAVIEKLPTYPEDIKTFLKEHPHLIEDYAEGFKKGLILRANKEIGRFTDYRQPIPLMTSEISSAIEDDNFNPGMTDASKIHGHLNMLDKHINNNNIKNQIVTTIEHIKDIDNDIGAVIDVLIEGERINNDLEKPYAAVAAAYDALHKEYKVEMKSTHTGTPGIITDQSKEHKPEVYGDHNLPSTREGDASKMEIAKQVVKHRGIQVDKPITKEELKQYKHLDDNKQYKPLDDVTISKIIKKSNELSEKYSHLPPFNDKIRSELHTIFKGVFLTPGMTSKERKMERVNEMFTRFDRRLAPPMEDLNKVVKWVIDKPKNAENFILKRDPKSQPNLRYEVIDFAIKIQEAIAEELKGADFPKNKDAQTLIKFYNENVEGKAVTAVVDELHHLQDNKKESFSQCQKFLSKLDTHLLKSVCNKLEDSKVDTKRKFVEPNQPKHKFIKSKVSLFELSKRSLEAKQSIERVDLKIKVQK